MQTTKNLVILFADIAGSTRLYERLGNNDARTITSKCLDQISRIVSGNDGTTIKTIGDEIMCVFSVADNAAKTAIAIQEQVAMFPSAPGVPALQMRIGFHAGEVISENNDVFGDAVNVAARMTAQAKAEQIITTRTTLNMLSPYLRASGRHLKETHIHGKNERIHICELTWGAVSELTLIGGVTDFTAASSSGRSTSLSLTFQGQEITVSQDSPPVTFGRGEDNTVIVENIMVSRRHARVEWRSCGDFFLVDQSTNGVYLLTANKEKRFIHRDEIQLINSGTFWLGQDGFSSFSEAVSYSVGDTSD